MCILALEDFLKGECILGDGALSTQPFIKGEVHQRVRPGVRPDVRPGVWPDIWPDVRPDVRAAPVSSEGKKKRGGSEVAAAPPAKIRGFWGAAPTSQNLKILFFFRFSASPFIGLTLYEW